MIIRRTILFIVFINLINYLNIINPDRVFYFTIYSGISLNISDFLALIMFSIVLCSSKKEISSELWHLLIYFFISVIIVCALSFLALDASLGMVGGRLRQYFCYFFIPGTIFLIKDEKDLRFFFFLIFAIGTFACLIHYLEFINGKSFFYISDTGVSGYYSTRITKFNNIPRIWSRCPSVTLYMLAISLACFCSGHKRKKLFVFTFILSVSSILLSFTRTAYFFVIMSTSVIFLVCAKKRFISSSILSLFLLITVLASLFLIFGKGGMQDFTDRFTTSYSAIADTKHTSTFDQRKAQFNYRMKRMRKSNYPTIFGMGITNKSVKLLTSDLGYMNIFLNLGVLGIIFVIWVYIYLFKKCFKLINTINEGFYSFVIIGIIGIVSGMIIGGINFDYFTVKAHFPLLFLSIVTVELVDKFNRKRII